MPGAKNQLDRPPVPRGLCVHHAAETFAVVEKPAHLPSVPARGADEDPRLADSVQTRAREAFPHAEGPITVHRLDMDTSGLIVVALDPEAHRNLSKQFQNRRTGKGYLALLDGVVDPSLPQEGAIDLPLIVDWPNRPRHHVNFTDGKPSRTLYRILGTERWRDRDVTRVSFRPLTGRTHQLRLHAMAAVDLERPGPIEPTIVEQTRTKKNTQDLAPTLQGGLGLPIVGDTLYSEVGHEAPRLMLHAEHLAFWHPVEGERWLKFHAPIDFDRWA
jgi:tRNA pseudouridine32 synthase/23S rRNA pseudouridine746 synthase